MSMNYKLIVFPIFIVLLSLFSFAAEQSCTMEMPPGMEVICSLGSADKDLICGGGMEVSGITGPGGGAIVQSIPPTFVNTRQNPITDYTIVQQMHMTFCDNTKYVCEVPCQYTEVRCRTRGTYNTLPKGQENPDRSACATQPPAKKSPILNLFSRFKIWFTNFLKSLGIFKVQKIYINKTIILNVTPIPTP